MALREDIKLQFLPVGHVFKGGPGDTLLDAALDSGLYLEHECGGNCTCTTCHVVIEEGWDCLSPPEEPEQYRLTFAQGLTPRSRLACQALLRCGPISFRLP